MIKRARYNSSVSGIADDLIALYAKYPQYRGTAPNGVINIAVREWLNQKLNKSSSNHQSNGGFCYSCFSLDFINCFSTRGITI